MGSGIQGEDVQTTSMTTFEFGEPRIACGNKGAGVWVMGVLGTDDM